jgi:hypothetical protein
MFIAMKRKLFFVKGFLSLLMATAAISACKDEDPQGAPSLYVGEVTTFSLSPMGGTKIIELQTNVEVSLNTSATAEWCTVSLSGKTLTVTFERNATFAVRSTSAEVSITGKSETLTFEQGGQATAKFVVDTATASSEQPGEPITRTYDGVIGDIYHSAYDRKGEAFELIYYLKPNAVLDLALIVYYCRSGVGNGTFGFIDVEVATGGNNTSFTNVLDDYLVGDHSDAVGKANYPRPAFIELPEPIANVTAVKIIVDGQTSSAQLASCAEMEFYGIGAVSDVPYIMSNITSHYFDFGGGSVEFSAITNAESFTANAPGWCTATVNGSFVTLEASANTTGEYREAIVTITGSNGATEEVKIMQPRTVGEGRQLAVDLASPDSYADSWASDDGNALGVSGKKNGLFELMFDYTNLDYHYDTYWHSNYEKNEIETNGPITSPHNLYIHLASASSLSYIAYYVRNYPEGNRNGNWGAIEVYVKYSGGSDWEYQMSYNCGRDGNLSQIIMPRLLHDVTDVRIRITSQQNSSCSELKFFSE